MAAFWTMKKDGEEEDKKTVNPFEEAQVKADRAQYPPRQVYHCSECKAEIHRGDVFCPGCGQHRRKPNAEPSLLGLC